MFTISYNSLLRLTRALPVCPKPKSIGLENIPKGEPFLYVFNHISKRGEGFYLYLAAPMKPNMRFFSEITLFKPEYLPRTRNDIANSVFHQKFQRKAVGNRLLYFFYMKIADLMARLLMAEFNRCNFIQVYLHDPPSEEEKLRKQRVNRLALEECVKSVENNIPLAIAPSGGSTHAEVENQIHHTIVPTLASWLYKKGKVVKIVPSIVRERPMINNKTYKQYVADRLILYRLGRMFLDRLGIKKYKRPCLTVEFLPPLTFEKANPTKSEKVEFVKELQDIIYDSLKRE